MKKVILTWNSKVTDTSRKVYIYGSNEVYTSPADLYDSSKQGTQLASLNCTQTTIEISGEYAYVGIRSNNTVYLDKIEITWE